MTHSIDFVVHPKFWDKITKTDTCWVWTGSVNQDGYGLAQVFKTDGRHSTMMAHRAAFSLEHGRRPTQDLHHICRNRKCVRPDHLVEITRPEHAKEWTRDKPSCGHVYDYFPSRVGYTTPARYCKICYRAVRKKSSLKWLSTPQGRAWRKVANHRAYLKRKAAKAAVTPSTLAPERAPRAQGACR